MKRRGGVARTLLAERPIDADPRPQLEITWGREPGLWGWLSETNHKSIAIRYLVTAFVFFGLGGVLALLMRTQLIRPENHFLSPEMYNQIFTIHGTTMMFLFAVPVMEGIGIYLIPLMIGTRNFALPRLNALGYWMFLFGGIFLFTSFFVGAGPDVGWFSYVPLAGPEYTPAKRADVWAQLITFTEVSALIAAVNTIVTAFKLRAPGMTLTRIPLFVWAQIITAFMIIFAMPAVMLSSTSLILDRLVGTHFFNPAEGGDVLLWQHQFWFFGHPEVYIIFIPALGMISAMLPSFTRRKVFGYVPLLLSQIAIGFLGFGLWVHHMFVTGLPRLGEAFFTAASMAIAVPSGMQVFCWIATLWRRPLRWRTPLLFILGFFFIFVMGGLTGVMLASVSLDQQLHDSYFVVAHFHYVLIGGALFPLFGGVFYWFPKMSGRMLSERLGRWSFWLMFTGFNVTFFPMHQLGLMGMPRRVATYGADTGWQGLNVLAGIGALVLTAGVLTYLINIARSLRAGPAAGPDPWEADGLEWSTPSPPPRYNFAEPPVVESVAPLWEGPPGRVLGLRSDVRDVLVTHESTAEPEHRSILPAESPWPFFSAITITGLFVASIFTPWGVVWWAIPVAFTLTAWFWPKGVGPPNTPESEGEGA